jgi:hypothetical protein
LVAAIEIKRVFEIDITVCPHCGGTLRFIADVTDPEVIRTILDYLKQRAPPAAFPRQASPPACTANLFAASITADSRTSPAKSSDSDTQ